MTSAYVRYRTRLGAAETAQESLIKVSRTYPRLRTRKSGKAQDNPFKWSLIALPVSLLLLSIGLYRELTISIVPEAETMEISSFNVPGSFNNWVPAANEMQQIDEDTYVLDVEFAASSVIEFKFTPNKS